MQSWHENSPTGPMPLAMQGSETGLQGPKLGIFSGKPRGLPLGAIFQRARPPGANSACRTVAYFATLVQLCLSAAPMILSVQLGFDPDVEYWIGRIGRWALVVPVYTMLLHVVHVWQITHGRQNRSVFIFMVIPMVLLCFTGYWYMSPSANIQAQLFSEDCTGRWLPGKLRLQQAYEEAHAVYLACTQRILGENGTASSFRQPTLQSCEEWASHANATDHRGGTVPQGMSEGRMLDFNYLAYIEANHVCGGFCHPGPALWNAYGELGRAGGKCAPLVAGKFSVVRGRAELVFWVGFSNVVIFIIGYLHSRPLLARLGYGGSQDFD